MNDLIKNNKPKASEGQVPSLKFSDDFVFCAVMQNMDLCRDVLQVILGHEIGTIKNVINQAEVANTSESKNIRLDVLVQNESGNLYDVEIQVLNEHNLAKRMRYYQSAMDINMLFKGENYTDIQNVYIIFICMFDYFGKGLPMYTFKNICIEDKNIYLKDGVKKIKINAGAFRKELDEARAEFFRYVKTGEVTGTLSRRIQKMVDEVIQRTVAEGYVTFKSAAIMDAEAHGRREGRIEGEAYGLKKGRLEGRQEGAYQKALETARNLKLMDMPISQIAKATGLSEKEIRNL